MINSPERRFSAASGLLAALFGLMGLALLVTSLGWEYSRDTPLLNYVGFLIWEQGFAPYRDIFETSMPGTLAFHSLVAGLGLDGNLAFMILANCIVLGFSLLGALAILPLGRAGALIAFPLLVTTMLIMGPGWILKIDMVALLPISAALCLAIWQRPTSVGMRQFLIGGLFGIAGTMKPHLMLGAPIVVLAAYGIEHWTGQWRTLPRGRLMAQIGLSLLGFAVPVLMVVLWLYSSGALPSFVFVLTEYLPLHLEKTDWQEFVSPEMKDRIRLSMTLRFGGFYHLVPVAALAPLLALILRRHLDSRQIILLAALCMLTMIYGLAPWLGGQFYIYYYFPFFFFALLLIAASVSLVERSGLSLLVKSVWVLCIGSFLFVYGSRFYWDGLWGPNRLEQVARMEVALTEWVPEGGRVQPIDWTSGVVPAMLRQKVLPATPYLYDYHFHHHVGSSINEGLRNAFISALEAEPPEVIIEAREFPRVSGLNTSDRFPQRDAFLAERYRLVAEEEAFLVYLRNDLTRFKAGGS